MSSAFDVASGPVDRRLAKQWLGPSFILLAFALRIIGLHSRPLWYDEAFSLLYAALDPGDILAGTVTPVEGAGAADVHPLLYYFVLHGWMQLVGESPFAARFLSLLVGLITVALLTRLGRRCFGPRIGAAVGFMGAVNPFHVAYSQEARMYALLGLGAVLAAWGLSRATDERRLRWWALYAGGAALTIYAHNLGAVILAALHLPVVLSSTVRRDLACLALADLLALLLFGPWLLVVMPGQIGFVGQGYWLSPPGAEEVVRALMVPVLTFYEPSPLWLNALGLFTSLLIAALVVLAAWRVHSRVRWFLLVAWAPVLMLFVLSLWRPVYLERALLPSALFYLVAVGWLLGESSVPGTVRAGVALLLTASIVGSLSVHYLYEEFPRPPYRAAIEYLEARVVPGDAVVHTNKLTYFPMHAYDADLPGAFLADPPGSPQDTLAYPTQQALDIYATSNVTSAVGDASRAWVVYFPREVREAQALAGEHKALTWLDAHFARMQQEHFSDLVVALYQREGE